MNPRIGIVVLAIAVTGALAAWRLLPRRPNVIVIAIDTLRADALGSYGGPGNPTPYLDALAAESVRFDQATASACWTLPSFASMLTGVYPDAHGVRKPTDRLSPTFMTLAELLKDGGYRTAAFTAGGYLAPTFGLSQGFDEFDHKTETGRFREKTARVLDWIDGADEPFFVLFHGYDVHSPYAPGEPPPPPRGYAPPGIDVVEALNQRIEKKRRTDDLDLGALQTAYLTVDPGSKAELTRFRRNYADWEGRARRPIVETWRSLPRYSDDLSWIRASYDAEVREMDQDVGAFLAALAARGYLDDTVVVVVSDHGEAFMEHGECDHQTVNEIVARVPLLIRPAGGTTGRVVADPVRGLDLFATLLDVCGIEYRGFGQGRSLVPALSGGALPPEPACCFQNAAREHATDEVSIRWQDWKLITGGRFAADEPPYRLFDLGRDPGEETDLGAGEPERASRLLDMLARIRTQSARYLAAVTTATATLDEDTIRALTELGYLGMVRDRGAPTDRTDEAEETDR